MLCPKCETENKEENKTCIKCGEDLLNDSDHATDESTQTVATSEHTAKVAAKPKSKSRPKPKPKPKPESKPIVHQGISGAGLKAALAKSGGVTTVSNGFYIGVMIATVIFPIIGIIMGFTYMRKEHPTARKAGKSWLIVGGAIILAQVVVIFLY